jgi:choline dehydrogenase-like flavoprotein
MQIIKESKIYDVIVIGSGASGAMAAWNLTQQGVEVLMLDAGDYFKRETFWTHVWPYEWRERVKNGERPPEFFLSTKEHLMLQSRTSHFL